MHRLQKCALSPTKSQEHLSPAKEPAKAPKTGSTASSGPFKESPNNRELSQGKRENQLGASHHDDPKNFEKLPLYVNDPPLSKIVGKK